MAEARSSWSPQPIDVVSRRDFVRSLSAAALAATAVPLIGTGRSLAAAAAQTGPSPSAPAETGVARLFKTFTDEQKQTICFPFDHPLRSEVKNNWAIVKPRIDDMSTEQQEVCREVMRNLCSEDGYDRFMHQMDEDYGGFEQYHVAVFGEPGSDKPFEWVLTGRHITLRADGNSVDGAAFGGPIFYGHASHSDTEDAKHTDNVWWFQGAQANVVFQSLDEQQRKRAMIEKSPADSAATIKLKGEAIDQAPGIPVADLDSQQKALVKKLLEDMVQPFRVVDAQEVRECLDHNGGIDKLRITYAKEGDLGNDGVWDIWKLEGPTISWFFRGSPHVHTWLNVARQA